MHTRYIISTPLGQFATMKQAAAAHHCDRATLIRRIQQDPDQYRRVERPRIAAAKKNEWAVRGVRWPISWAQYRLQDHDTREAIWNMWIRHHELDPDLESTATAFFDEMDSYTGESLTTPDEADQDCALDETPTA
jgi:hypothetical protein